jgi:hypothetical protein
MRARMRLPSAILSLLCFVACGPSEDLEPRPGEAVPLGRYIVRLQDPAPGVLAPRVRDQAQELTTRYGGTVLQVYETSFRGFTVADLAEDGAEALGYDPAVARIEKDSQVKVEPE